MKYSQVEEQEEVIQKQTPQSIYRPNQHDYSSRNFIIILTLNVLSLLAFFIIYLNRTLLPIGATINLQEYPKFFENLTNNLTIIQPKEPLRHQYEPIFWPQFQGTLPKVDISVVMVTTKRNFRGETIKKSLTSFFKYNTYPIKKLIVVNDGQTDQQLENIIKIYPNITWILTNTKVGQLLSLDLGIQFIKTSFFMQAEDDFQYIFPGSIQYMLQALEYDPHLSSIYISPQTSIPNRIQKTVKVGPLIIHTELQAWSYSGLTLSNSVHRMSDYNIFEGGYNKACYNISFGLGAGSCEQILSIKLVLKGFHMAISTQSFAKHLGAKTGLKKKSLRLEDYQFGKELLENYWEWFQDHSTLQKQFQNLKYLQYKQL